MGEGADITVDMNDDFAKKVLAMVPETSPTGPSIFYNEDGDCIEFIFGDESFRAERIDGLVTVYYGRESGEIVGSLIKGVRRFVREFSRESPGFVIEVEDGPVKLWHLITAGMWKQGDPVRLTAYKKIRDAAERLGVSFEMPEIACGSK
jgi:hypothetical protein